MMATFTNRAGLSASVFGSRQEHDAVGGALGWRPEGSPLALRLGWIGEDETILGGEGHGAFGSLAADTAFVRVEGGVRLGAWRLGANAEWGSVRPRARGGLIDDVSAISTSAFAVHARAAVTDEDVVRFSVSQPLRVEDGRASLTLPVARTKYGAIQHASFAPDLTPDERQIDLSATWERPLAEGAAATGRHLEPEPRPQRVRRPDPHVPRGLAAGILNRRNSTAFTRSDTAMNHCNSPSFGSVERFNPVPG